MDHVLPVLVETAETARDRQAVRARQALSAQAQGEATLQRLREFRAECLARTPAARHGRADGLSLADTQRFLTRLDEAIDVQQQEVRRRTGVADEEQRRLLQAQQRVLAFQALRQRRASALALRESRTAQRQSDEFAARSAARHAQEDRS